MKIFRPLSIALAFALAGGLLALVGCADIGVASYENPPVVSAQQTYSTRAVTGLYSYLENGVAGSQPHSSIGTVSFDGNGNVSGSLTEYYISSPACQFSLTGTYSINSTAAGTGTFSAVATTPGCSSSSGTVALQAAEQGQTVLVARNDGQELSTGTAIRQ